MQPDVLGNFYVITDALFRVLAEETAARETSTVEEAYQGWWSLYERGLIQLVSDADGPRTLPCVSRNERRAAAKQNGPLSLYRRRLLGEGAAPATKHDAWGWVEQVENDARVSDHAAHIACSLVENCADGDVFIETGVPPSTALLGYSDRAVRVAFSELERDGHLAFDDVSQRFRPQRLLGPVGEELAPHPPEARQQLQEPLT
jgi:hypothetical protein